MLQLINYTLDANTAAAGATHVGLRRSHNEDAFLIDPAIGLIALADGIGGQEAGEVASSEAIKALQDYLNTSPAKQLPQIYDSGPDLFQPGTEREVNLTSWIFDQTMAAVMHANDEIFSLNQKIGLPVEKSMGTTVLGLVNLPDDKLSIVAFYVGDSRLYRMREGNLEQLTRDDTLHQDWLDEGSVGIEPPKNILSQCVGSQSFVKPTIFVPSFRRGDLLLLCSDGLSDLVDEAELRDRISETNRERLDITCNELITAANNHGGKDNITAILVSRQ